MKLIILIAALIALVACQDSFGLPDKLLADINPGPDSSYPEGWYQIGEKAYTSVTITGKIFKQIVVTDGTTAGTKLLQDIDMSIRGNPYVKDPFWVPTNDNQNMVRFTTFDGIVWLTMWNYNTSNFDVWTIDPADDILTKYEGGIVTGVDVTTIDYLNIQNVEIFKGEYFTFNDDAVDHGLYFFDKSFNSYTVINNASDFMITPDPYDPFTGFDESSTTYLITDDFLIIDGWVQNYGGLWAYDGTTVWPLNLATSKFHDSLKVYDAVNKKLYYIAFFNNLPQLVVNDLNNVTANYTILTNLNQDCFPTYNCFSYLGLLNDNGTVAFAYNTQLGFTDGTLSRTTFLIGTPRAYDVLGAYNGKLYFRNWVDYGAGALMVIGGPQEGARLVLNHSVTSFTHFDGVILLGTPAGLWRLDQSDEFTFIRDIYFTGIWTRVTLPNNNQQLYLYYKTTRSCGRGCSRKIYYIYVTDGHGAVRFTDTFRTTFIQPLFLNNRFLMSATSDSTGTELFYMDAAQESYETPPPVAVVEPGSLGPTTSGTAKQIATYFHLFVLIAFLL